MNFIYFSRLSTEKGFDLVIGTFLKLISTDQKHNLYIFGEGPQKSLLQKIPKNNLVDLSKKGNETILNFLPTQNQIIFCGQKDYLNLISKILKKNIDYTLIPSKLIETFGLTALESIQNGVPILSPNKGGLADFVLAEHEIELNSEAISQKIASLSPPTPELREQLFKQGQLYSPKNWLTNFQKIAPLSTKKILIVSDFKQKFGGTEQHFYSAKKLLQSKYQVQILSFNKKPNILNLLKSIYNLSASRKIQQTIDDFQPDFIWCHSTLRYIGPKGLKTIKESKVKTAITIHDLGYFCSHPSKAESLQDIQNQKTSLSYKLKNTLLLRRLNKIVSSFDFIVVPNKFLLQIVKSEYNKQPILLPHFSENSND